METPKGIPLIFLRGGPGACTDQYCSRFFDKRYFNIIIFDQRGCGTAKPLGELKNNNTQCLIEDIEKIRIFCNFKKFVIFGGSWGASLAILYTISYPKNIITFVTRNISLMKDPIFTDSFRNMYPEYWDNFIKLGDNSSIKNTVNIYFKNIKRKNKQYINNWHNLEFKSLSVRPEENTKQNTPFQDKYICSLLESYYYKNNFFIPENYVLNNCCTISNIPGYIIVGRLDVICNPKDSFDLHSKLPKSKLYVVESAGHHYVDYLIAKKLVETSKEISNFYFSNRKDFYV